MVRDPDRLRAPLLVGLGSVCYAAFTFAWFALAAFLAPIVAELGLSSTLAGIVTGAIPLTYVPVALASGLVVDRIGPGRAIGGGLAIVGAAHALRSTAAGFPELFLLTAAMGVGGTGLTFGLPKLVSVTVPANRRGSATSVYVVAASAGMAIAFATGRPVLGAALGGWRPAFWWSGLVILAVALAWLVVIRILGPGQNGAAAAEADAGSVREDLMTVLTHRGLRLLVVVGTVYLLVMHGTQAWLPTIMEGRGLSAGLAAGLATLLVVARTVGILAIPPLSDWLGLRRPVVIACGALVAAGVGGLLVTGSNLVFTAAVVVVAGLGLGGLAPLVRTLPIELPEIGPRLTGTATGLIFTIGEIGGFLGPVVLGVSVDVAGTFDVGLAALAVAGLAVVVAGWLLPPFDVQAGS